MARPSRRRLAAASRLPDGPAAPRVWVRALPFLVLSLIVAAATTAGQVRIEPRPLVASSAALVAAAAILAPRRLRAPVAVVAVLALGAAAGEVLTRPGMPRVHDLMHLWGIWAYGRSVGEGSVLPLWIPYLGAGEPVLQFYGPMSFLLALPGILAGLSPVGAWKLELFMGHVLSAASMLAAARLLGAGWRVGIVAGAAGAFAPWRLAVFDYRGALGEANAFIFLPLVVASSFRMATAPSIAVGAVAAASVGCLALTHLVSLLTLLWALVPALGVWVALSRGRAGGAWRLVALATLPWVAVLGLTAGWWVPAVAELGATSAEAITSDNPFYAYREQGVSPAALLERKAWDRLRVSIPATLRREQGLEGEQMPFYFGALLMGLGLSAGWWSRRAESWALAAGAAVALSLGTTALAGLGSWLPVLAPVRFPWRFLTPATVLAGLAFAAGARELGRARARWLRPVALGAALAALVWDGLPYTGAADRIPPYRGVVHWYTEDPGWVYWETSMRPVAVSGLPEGAILRVRNLELPPSEYPVPVDSFFPGYYEWLTPTVYRTYWRSTSRDALAEAGVCCGFSNARREPDTWAARPYATLAGASGAVLPVRPRLVGRKPGRILLEAEAPTAGARLVVLEQWFPGWKARVGGGRWAPPESERGFMGVDLPEGRHQVELSYGLGTPARRAGIAISLATLVLGAAVAARRPLRRRPRGLGRDRGDLVRRGPTV